MKAKTVFACEACGYETARWLGRCPQCSGWNTFGEVPASLRAAPRRGPVTPARGMSMPIRLDDVSLATESRRSSGFAEFDRLLGGGVVPGSLVLVGGAPGVGKSTLLLQLAAQAAGTGRVVYVCAEESAAQAKLRAERLAIRGDVFLFAETDLAHVLEVINNDPPDLLIVDSIQTVALPETESYAGSVVQIRDCTTALAEFAKRTNCATFLVGHVTKDGQIAGPRLLEHLVDVVLYFEGEQGAEHRIVRAYKNRFGSVDEICVFSMEAAGLREIANPSELFLGTGGMRRDARPSGTCVVASIVGSRPVLVEVQALVGETAFGTPRRLAANIDPARLAMIVAVLERRGGLRLGDHDVYASIAGGLRVTEPAADLAIALSIASAYRNVPLANQAVAFGELGLSGEIRPVHAAQRRVAEARRLGFSPIYASSHDRNLEKRHDTVPLSDISVALAEGLQR